ncbi:MAG: hypothetical protein R3C20_04750 [Planctomycetaceae bacterium]
MISDELFLNDQQVADLISFGMPATVAHHIQVTRGLRKLSCAGAVIGQLLLLIAGIIGTTFGLFQLPMDRIGIWLGLIPDDTWLIDMEPVSAVVAVFVGIILSALIFFLILNARPLWRVPTAISGIQMTMQGSRDAASRWLNGAAMKAVIRRIDPELPIDDYLQAYSLGCIRVSLTVLVPAVLLLAMIFIWDLISAGYVAPNGVFRGGHFATDRRVAAWSEITQLQTGSYMMGTTMTLRSVLHFSDGCSIDLANAHSSQRAKSQVMAFK